MAKLSAQEKLALALTSAGSQRKLAEKLGISHQKLGRWLREGEPGGVKVIPRDPFTQAGVDAVFAEHRDVARRRARADKIPFLGSAPVYAERKPMSTGQLGDRVFVERTEFIRRRLRQKVFQDAVDSRKFYTGSVRSVVNLRSYFRGRASEEIARRRRADISVTELAHEMQRGWKGRERVQRGRIIDDARPFPLYTTKEGLLLPGPLAVQGIEKQFREKHEPATGKPGTVAADQYLFQVVPADYEPPQVKSKRATSRSRKQIRGRGPK